LWVLDEPTSNLDPTARQDVLAMIQEAKGAGRTVLVSSHVLSEVESTCNELLILKKGQAVRSGKPSELVGATGECRLRVAALSDAVRIAVQSVMGTATWDGSSALIRPRDGAHLNELIDLLRALPCEIEAVEPVRSTLEQYFIEVVTAGS